MKKLTYLVIVLFLLFPICSVAQTLDKQLLEIIYSDNDINLRQQKIESFLKKNENTLSEIERANCYYYLSYSWYYPLRNNRKKSKFYGEKSIILYENLINKTEGNRLVECYYSLAAAYQHEGQYYKQTEALYDLLDILNTDNSIDFDTKYTYIMLSNRGLSYCYNRTGDPYKALAIIERAISIYRNDEKKYISDNVIVSCYIMLADIYTALGKKYATKLLKCANKLDAIFKRNKNIDSYYKSSVYRNKGNALFYMEKYKEAIESYKLAITFLNPKDKFWLSVKYNRIGASYMKLKQYNKAFISFEKAIKICADNMNIYKNLGELYLEQKEFKKSLFNYQKAINQGIFHDSTKTAIHYNKKIPLKLLKEARKGAVFKIKYIIGKANAWLKYYEYDHNITHLEKALQTFKETDQLIDFIRSDNSENQSKLHWQEIRGKLYLNAVKVCSYLNNPEMAFYFMEKNKALLLLEDVTNEQAKINSKLPTTVAKKEFELKRAIYLAQEQFLEAKDTTKTYKATLEEAIFEKKQQFEKFIDSIAILYPKYAASKKNIKLSTNKSIRKVLKTNNQVVLQYILGDNEGYLVYGTHETMMLFPIANVPKLQDNIIQLLKQLQTPLQTQRELSTFKTYASNVFNVLIPETIQEKLKGKHIIIVPDQVLQKLPFEALVNKKNDHYFIEDSQISYAYSMSHLQALNRLQYDTKKGLLAFAPVNFSDKSLPKLPLSELELQKIKRYYLGGVFTHNKASKTAFLEYVKDHSILHLSTHAELGDNGNPWIAFADDKMTLNELYATKIKADLVVLSACQTGLGEVKKGEGVMSLARGFFSAGTKSVVSSLWNVNDKANEVLMSNFYKFLSQGETKATALHKAKLHYLNTHDGVEKSPHYWAPLVLVGDTSVITENGALDIVFLWVVVISIALLLLYIIVIEKAKSKTKK